VVSPSSLPVPVPMTTRQRLSLLFLGLATALAIIDATVVNSALPPISRHLGLSLSAGEWVVSGYGVSLAALLISAGRLADRFGQRRVLTAGVILFAAASAVCAAAPSGGVLITARVVQGVGAAAILPTVIGLINATFAGPLMSVAFAVYGATIGTAAAFGPLLGSALVDAFGWQAAFLVNLPLAVVIVIGLRATLSRDQPHSGDAGDPVGQVLLTASLALLVFGLVEAPRTGWFTVIAALDLGPVHWASGRAVSPAFAALLLAAAAAVLFAAWQSLRGRRGRATLIDLSLFAIPSFRAGTAAVLVVALGEFGVVFVLPLYLQVGHGLSPLRAQLLLLPTALGSFISAPITASRRTVPARTWVLLGLALETLGLLVVGAVLYPSAPPWLLILPLLVYGAGVGFAISQLTSATLLEIPLNRLGQASGVTSTARQIGSAIGVAVLTAVVSGTLALTLGSRIARDAPTITAAQRPSIVTTISRSPADPSAAGRALAAVTAQQKAGIATATTASLAWGTRWAALLAALPIAVAGYLSRRLPRSRQTPAPGSEPATEPFSAPERRRGV
jgi:EmrB/QacA subfamily drug resistance transporter